MAADARFRGAGASATATGMDAPVPVGTVRARFGEGPVWDAGSGCVWWVDIPEGAVHATDPRTGLTRTRRLDPPVSAVFLTDTGEAAVAAGLSVVVMDDTGEAVRVVAQVPGSDDERLNDGACDASGRLWVGTMPVPPGGARTGRLWRVEADASPSLLLDDVRLANGMGWSPDGKLFYLVDSLARRVDAFDVTEDGIEARRRLVDLQGVDGVPDGLAVDAEGAVWVVMAGGGTVRRHAADGSLLAVLQLPVSHPTSCCFGGEDLDLLFVTTGRPDQEDEREHPWAGHLLQIRTGVTGLPTTPMTLP